MRNPDYRSLTTSQFSKRDRLWVLKNFFCGISLLKFPKKTFQHPRLSSRAFGPRKLMKVAQSVFPIGCAGMEN